MVDRPKKARQCKGVVSWAGEKGGKRKRLRKTARTPLKGHGHEDSSGERGLRTSVWDVNFGFSAEKTVWEEEIPTKKRATTKPSYKMTRVTRSWKMGGGVRVERNKHPTLGKLRNSSSRKTFEKKGGADEEIKVATRVRGFKSFASALPKEKKW